MYIVSLYYKSARSILLKFNECYIAWAERYGSISCLYACCWTWIIQVLSISSCRSMLCSRFAWCFHNLNWTPCASCRPRRHSDPLTVFEAGTRDWQVLGTQGLWSIGFGVRSARYETEISSAWSEVAPAWTEVASRNQIGWTLANVSFRCYELRLVLWDHNSFGLGLTCALHRLSLFRLGWQGLESFWSSPRLGLVGRKSVRDDLRSTQPATKIDPTCHWSYLTWLEVDFMQSESVVLELRAGKLGTEADLVWASQFGVAGDRSGFGPGSYSASWAWSDMARGVWHGLRSVDLG